MLYTITLSENDYNTLISCIRCVYLGLQSIDKDACFYKKDCCDILFSYCSIRSQDVNSLLANMNVKRIKEDVVTII